MTSYYAAEPAHLGKTDSGTGRRLMGSAGVWCTDASPGAIHRLSQMQFDWVALDMQHGRYDRRDLIEAARGWDTTAALLVVRVPSSEFTGIGLALDVGADVVIVPQVDTPADAQASVDAARYPPAGRRSFGQLQPIWGAAARDPADANTDTCCAVMIESATALDNVEGIAAVPGVGMLFVGPNDLSLSLGTTISHLLDDQSKTSALQRIVDAARANNIPAGAFGGDPGTARRFSDRGFTFVACATDGWLLHQGAQSAFA